MSELLLCDAALLRCRHVYLWELVAPMPGPARIDDSPAIGVIADCLALGLRGSSGLAQALRMMSIEVAGSERVSMAQTSSSRFDTSMSSSTMTT